MSCYIYRFRLGHLRFVDSMDKGLSDADQQQAYGAFCTIKDERKQRVYTRTGVDPGCRSMRVLVTQELFFKQLNDPDGTRDYQTFKAQCEDAREDVEGITAVNRLLYAYDENEGWVGGVWLYNIQLTPHTDLAQPVLYSANVGPFLSSPQDTSSTLHYLLTEKLAAMGPAGLNIATQLHAITFPLLQPRNRWYLGDGFASDYMADLMQHCQVDLDSDDSGRYYVTRATRVLP